LAGCRRPLVYQVAHTRGLETGATGCAAKMARLPRHCGPREDAPTCDGELDPGALWFTPEIDRLDVVLALSISSAARIRSIRPRPPA